MQCPVGIRIVTMGYPCNARWAIESWQCQFGGGLPGLGCSVRLGELPMGGYPKGVRLLGCGLLKLLGLGGCTNGGLSCGCRLM